MYRVFLVDDESLIRNGIRQMIEWNEYGFAFVGEEADGELAWPQIQKLRPDIVLTDIKMPFMDGLELSRLIKKELPGTMVVILSGYDEFAYAKEALSIGVSEYLLKPINKRQLTEVLAGIKKRKDAEREKMQSHNNQMHEYLEALRANLLDALLNGRQPVSELIERAGKLDMELAAACYNTVFVQLGADNVAEDDPIDAAERQDVVYAALAQDAACAALLLEPGVFACKVGYDGIAFLLAAPTEEIEARTDRCVRAAQDVCAAVPDLAAWSVVTGEPVRRLSQVSACFRDTHRRSLQRRADALQHAVPAAAQARGVDFDPNDMDAERFDRRIIERFLSSGRSEDSADFVGNYFSAIGRKAMESLLFRQYVTLHIQFSVNAFLEHLNAKSTEKLNCRTQAPSVEELMTLAGTEQYVLGLVQRALEVRDQATGNKYGDLLHRATEYMEQNFTNAEISLNTVAQVVNVRPTYFSAVFSQQMGKTFVEYLTELRMEKAKELLRCTDRGSGDIAFEVGYNDPHYFSFLFKKVNGCSPRDYRAGRSQAK